MYYVTPRESSRLFEKGKNYLVLDHLHGQGGSFQLIVVAEDSTIQAQDYDLFSYVGQYDWKPPEPQEHPHKRKPGRPPKNKEESK